MPNTTKNNHLLTKLQTAFPNLIFKPSTRFAYRPPRTIRYILNDPDFPLLILHEIGHALISEQNFSTDIERLKIERAAWDKAAALCKKFNIKYDSDFVESKLDTYRDWLHGKSKCVQCGLTRYQDPSGTYHCPLCESTH